MKSQDAVRKAVVGDPRNIPRDIDPYTDPYETALLGEKSNKMLGRITRATGQKYPYLYDELPKSNQKN